MNSQEEWQLLHLTKENNRLLNEINTFLKHFMPNNNKGNVNDFLLNVIANMIAEKMNV